MQPSIPQSGEQERKDMPVDIETILILLLIAFIFGMMVGIMLVRPHHHER